jgi:putative FmdB family regulatory protein
MPVYEYKCECCGEKVERLEPVGADSSGKKCALCGKGKLKKVFSVFGSKSPVGSCSIDPRGKST